MQVSRDFLLLMTKAELSGLKCGRWEGNPLDCCCIPFDRLMLMKRCQPNADVMFYASEGDLAALLFVIFTHCYSVRLSCRGKKND